jgi:23S rRNA (guanosine2251-2'-O)-methyltransferase
MTEAKTAVLYGFHAVGTRLKIAPKSVQVLLYDASRLAGSDRHQGVVAKVEPLAPALARRRARRGGGRGEAPLLLVLDGVTDPHNLGACLRVADGAGAHAVIAPKDHAVGLNATVAKVASGAAETVPYLMVTNLARTLNELKERASWVGRHQADDAEAPCTTWTSPARWPGAGRRRCGHAPADAQDLRRWCASRWRRGGEPERLGGRRRVPVRGAAPAAGWPPRSLRSLSGAKGFHRPSGWPWRALTMPVIDVDTRWSATRSACCARPTSAPRSSAS